MRFVIIRVACINCGYESVMVSAKGQEKGIKCYRCLSDVEVTDVLREVGTK